MHKGKDICTISWREGTTFMDKEILSLETEAFAHLKLGNLIEARTKIEETIAKNPKSARLKHNLAKFFIYTEAYNDALLELNNIPDLATDNEILWKDRGLVNYKLGNQRKALECIKKALKINKNFTPALLIKTKIFSKSNKFTEALSILDNLLSIDSHNREALYQRGSLFFNNKKYRKAISDFDKILEIKKNDADSLRSKGLAYDMLGEFEKSSFYLQKSLTIEDDLIYNDRGVALSRLGYYNDSISNYEKAIEIKPNSGTYWFNLGKALYRVGKLNRALESFENSTFFSPENTSAWNNRGVTLRHLNRFEEALDCYEKAIQLKNDYAWAWHNKGYALESLNRFDEAVISYQTALSFRLDYKETVDALERLNKLSKQ